MWEADARRCADPRWNLADCHLPAHHRHGGPIAGPTAGGGGGNAVTSWLGQFAQLLLDGIQYGVIIAITAVGLSLIFGTTG